MRLLYRHTRRTGSKTLLGRIVGRRERCKPGTTQTFSRFSGEAREVLELAQTETRALDLAVREAKADHSLHAGTEHLLLALARVTDGLAAEVLREVGLNEPAIRKRREVQEQERHRHGSE